MPVVIKPLPEWCKKVPEKYRPVHPPIFLNCGEGGPTPEDIELARELFALLDEESKEWYQRSGGIFKNV